MKRTFTSAGADVGIGRGLVAGFGAVLAAIVWTPTWAALLGSFGFFESHPLTAARVILLPLALWGGYRFARRLPESFDHSFDARRGLAVLWILLALVSLFQVARLSTYMVNPESDWYLSTPHPFWAKHECLTAYLYGAELNERGESNIYDSVHYPGLSQEARPESRLDGMVPEDPFQYPPQFLLVPRLALFLTNDYTTIRAVWFGLQWTLFALVAGGLALWVGGRSGRLAVFLLPVLVMAFPTLHNFQYGQFHLSAIALAVGALLAFNAKRNAVGGAMLATAILSKIFPGLLLIPLAVERRWKNLSWTLGFGAALTFAAWAVVGTAPFVSFIEYQLPRLQSGEAFAFGEVWPEIRELVIADNQGAYGLVLKLAELGVPGLSAATAIPLSRLFGLAVVALTVVVSFRLSKATRLERAAGWLAIVGLGSMTSPGAWGDYVPATSVWLMTLVAYRLFQDRWSTFFLATCGVFQFFILGTTPIGNWAPPEVMIPLSVVGVTLMLALYVWALLAVPARQTAGDRKQVEILASNPAFFAGETD